MAKGKNQKLKLLYLSRIMKKETDDEHGLTMPEIIQKLSEYDIDAHRKSLYEDIELLNDFGIEIIKDKIGNKTYYKCGQREFEAAELKVLVDAVQSSRMITAKKSRELITKIEENLSSKYAAKNLNREVYVLNRVKSDNESIYITVDQILTAENENKNIAFQYFKWNIKGDRELKHGGQKYRVSPWTLVWDDENYYLIAYDIEAEKIKHFRVDKMLKVELLDETRAGKSEYEKIDTSTYADKLIKMYEGEIKTVKLISKNELANVVFDSFGKDIFPRKEDEEHFKVSVDVAVTKQFFGWIFGLGGGIKIEGPEEVVEEYKNYLEKNLELYS